MWAGQQAGSCICRRFPLEEAFRSRGGGVARKKGRGTGQGGGQPQKPGPAGAGSGAAGGWAPPRDSSRRDIEQAVAALAFAERLHQKMDTQRRAFLDFPRVMEQLRSGAVERLTASLSRLYEGGQGFDLQRFLRDLPLALAQLAAADKSKSRPPAAPRRSPGPWRADREVLEEARRAVEFVQKLYDAYAEAWADQPLAKDLGDQTAAELDRFLAWTQLDRYVELAVLASTNAPRPAKPGQHVISAPKEAAST